ncbi:MAG: hypothetical protein OEL50_04365 [Rhodospirillaceae bacterium]|nr:hypothetical protein [Rhodospirillaceae bacterium]
MTKKLIIFFETIAVFFLLALNPANMNAAEQPPEIPFIKQWAASAHADSKAEAFRHWDKDGEVSKRCAQCHSSDGFKDFIGADGSDKGVVDSPAPTTSTITCTTCHNTEAGKLASVTFPSGTVVANAGKSARCMVCHQGRQSSPGVDRALGAMDPDTVSDKLNFLNVHYAQAGATLWGSAVAGGYQYAGNDYQGLASHPENVNECTQCHDPHGLNVRIQSCASCHQTVSDEKSLKNIRTNKTDFDGDGNNDEGIAGEISTMHEALLSAIQVYGKKLGNPIVYDGHSHPYFFIDTNANGVADKQEVASANKYKSWTPRLLKAAYNYQYVAKDNGAYAHNPRYAMQLLFDSINDLSKINKTGNAVMARP